MCHTRSHLARWGSIQQCQTLDRSCFCFCRNEVAQQDAFFSAASEPCQQPQRRHVVGGISAAVYGQRVSREGVSLIKVVNPIIWGVGQVVTVTLAGRVDRKPLIVSGMIVQALGHLVISFGSLELEERRCGAVIEADDLERSVRGAGHPGHTGRHPRNRHPVYFRSLRQQFF